MKVTYYGHACFAVETNGVHILFDPFISPNELAANIDIDKVKADYILISHGHEDHIADAVSIAKRTGAKVVSNFEIYQWLTGKGIENAHPMNSGGKWNFGAFTVKCCNAVHSSSLPDGSNGGNPMGFIVEAAKEKFYYSGDTALSMDMKLIGDFENPQVCFFPIGDNFTMGVEDAIRAAAFTKCKKIIGIHFDTFGFIKIDKQKAQKAFADAGLELRLMNIGETITI